MKQHRYQLFSIKDVLTGNKLEHCLFGILLCTAFVFIMFHAHINEDAFITFRVVDNFIHGYGLRWNIDERVQVYTHPLWMLLHIPVYYFIPNIYLASSLISALLMITLMLMLFKSFQCGKF